MTFVFLSAEKELFSQLSYEFKQASYNLNSSCSLTGSKAKHALSQKFHKIVSFDHYNKDFDILNSFICMQFI